MRKRILFVRSTIFPTEHPGNMRIGSFAHYFAKLGYDVTLAMLSKENKEKTAENVNKAFQSGFVFSPLRIPKLLYYLISLIDRILRRFCFCSYDGYFQSMILEHAVLRRFDSSTFDLIVVSVPQFGSLRIASNVAKVWNIPWVVDFRDIPDEIDIEHRKVVTRKEFAYARKVCKTASFAVTVSEPLREALITRYGLRDVGIVFNGFEGTLSFNNASEIGRSYSFDIVYTGILAYGRDLSLLFKGLDILRMQKFDLSNVRIVLAGVSPQDMQIYSKYKTYDLVVALGRKTRKECIEIQRNASVLVCLASLGCVGILTSKIFDYACAGRPVLSIPKDNDVLDTFINNSGIGVSLSEAAEVAKWLKAQINAWRMNQGALNYNPNYEYITSFSRENQAIRFSSLLKERFED